MTGDRQALRERLCTLARDPRTQFDNWTLGWSAVPGSDIEGCGIHPFPTDCIAELAPDRSEPLRRRLSSPR
jgi:hypothetical protein